MYKICFYVPDNAVEIVKQALFAAGAGRIGNYDSCCWQVLGSGQFRPLENSNPAIGKTGKVETVSEYRVEMVCEDRIIKDVVEALRQSHPYEEPAYDVVKLEDF
jgi:hypothetical protein